MTKWIKLIGKWGRKSHIITSRFDPVTYQALVRVAEAEGVRISVLIYTAVRLLPEMKREIATIKREKKGARTRTTDTKG